MVAYVSKKPRAFPTFKESIREALPCEVRRENLPQFVTECDSLIDYECIGEPEMSALLTLSTGASQALDQREAVLSIEYREGAYFDTQTFFAPGTDLLADMIENDNAEGEL